MKNIILCGGSGTRLWPLSRKLMPKQFLKLFDGKSLFQKTVERNSKISDKLEVITNLDHYFIALDHLEEIDSKFTIQNTKFLLEEIGRNTAPAIAFAALESDKNEILFVTPSDHLIKDMDKYNEAVNRAKELAEEGYLVTFGINPTEPNTGYGYIECSIEDLGFSSSVFNVKTFHEKPDLAIAEKYLENNSKISDLKPKSYYLWNSGMFMFKAGVFLEELQKHSPKVYEEVLKSYEKRQIVNENQFRLKEMQNIPDISIDYAVMEKSDKIKAVKSEFDWNDVGSFDSLVDEIDSNEAIEINSKNNFYYTETKNKVIAAIGLEDFIVVDTKDALLITKKGQTQKVKDIVNTLKNNSQFSILNSPLIVHRPWGTFETLITDNGYKIKRIIVKPGKRLSLQKHFHRSEHWVVVKGTAEVQVGDKKFLVRANESTYIKMEEIHRLSNPGKVPVVLIEAQVGEYTGEDDIVRIEDDYKRYL
ncbi:mannose-1-phosphate guanylyltransferase/mannose-6-phosphate isomerase [Nautilia profundicola AmH]|uniref:mannose-1-phosphate guanylyltransferase n=1 Tax=Nautilia profundicola (strain ATCC BAA-1463 / DSM 18972 / AmH) TaxID=598659 RepID=B9L6R2_NAUPA|nr:mannose-1-phosphate guanylyltransferase/mannose-6-phosphate isomerase [Nautilia profundicola]ACM92754.1 mannose-1-phosphate guanylyltransferase/mannose-6-phosphate isomerase [Nautilia profundicola AmH]